MTTPDDGLERIDFAAPFDTGAGAPGVRGADGRGAAPASAHGFIGSARLPQAPDRAEFAGVATVADHAAGLEVAGVVAEALRMMAGGYSLRQVAAALGVAASRLSVQMARQARGGAAALRPQRRGAGAAGDLTRWIEGLGWFIPAARFFYLLSNRTWCSGSVPEAVRRTISLPGVPDGWKHGDTARLMKALGRAELPACPVELRELILDRQARGSTLVPERIARQISSTPARVRAYRNPTDFALDYLSTPGGMRLVRDVVSGELRLARALEIVEGDDATINFPVWVPWNRGGTKCADRHGCLVGRFQWLVFVDVGTSKVLGYSYTMRPRSSYRAEDVVTGMRVVCRQYGVPHTWRFERGVWKSHLVKGAIERMGSKLDTVYSPHQKPHIEGLFNVLWTKLSVHFPSAHVGRTRGEHEAANDLLTACQSGARDPRRYFPELRQALAAFDAVIREKDQTPVNSEHHGRWIPAERFAAQIAADAPRRLDPESDWMFAPFVREWTVRGMLVGGRVPLFEELSVPFEFSAPWLPDYDGARVACYFDPAEPKCTAQVCLAEAWNGKPAGTVLGPAQQVSTTAGYTRLVMGWGDDPEMAGVAARNEAARAVRREVCATVPHGARVSEERDGLGNSARIESHGLIQYEREDAPLSHARAEVAECSPSPRPSPAGRGSGARSVAPDDERLARLAAFEREHDLEFVG